jgi:hypothetical protein
MHAQGLAIDTGTPPELLRIDRRNHAARVQVVLRIRAEFMEMPGLSPTLPQAARLFGLPQQACARIFAELAAEGVLCRTRRGLWVRRDRLTGRPCVPE